MSWDDFPNWFKRRRGFPFFGSGFEEMDEMMREMEEMISKAFKEYQEKIPKELIKEKKLPEGGITRELGPVVYGYSVTVGPDGKPVIREFGNLKPSQHRPGLTPKIDIKSEREPLIDIITDDKNIKVVAEVPGVEKSDIKLHATKDTLTISVDAKGRKYYKELDLPSEVDPKTARSMYRNGVLEVNLRKISTKKPAGEQIKVE
jgi:HSP20 family protein